ncbi:MAG: PAS domain S-box protein [Candidatus Thorarchaeota archaeon]
MVIPPLIKEQSQYILDNIRDIIFTLSSDGKITSITQEFEKITGWSRDEWIGKHFLEIVHPDDTSVVVEGSKATINDDTVPPYEARIFTKSGEIVTLEVKPTPQIVDGEITGFLGIARDVTERKRTEESLRTSENQYRMIINSMGDAIHVINSNFKIIIANPAFSTWLKQLNLEIELVGKTIQEAFPFLPDKVLDEYHEVFSTGQTLITEEITPINDKIYYTETRKIPIFRDEAVVQVLTIIRDVTERTQIEKQLREREKNYRELICNLTDVVAELDAKGNFLFISPQALNLFGYHPSKVIGKSCFEFIHPDDIENAINIQMEALAGKRIFNFAYRIKHKDGHYIWVAVSGKATEYEGGLKLVSGIRDISEQKRMEKALRESEEQYRTLFENTPIGLYRTTPDLKFLAANPAFLNLVGLSSFNELVSIDANELAITRKYSRNRFLREIEDKGEVKGLECQLKRPDGSTIYFRENAHSIKDNDGIILYYEGSVEDITDQVLAQQALQESEERLRSFMDGATDSYSLFDSELNLIDVNKTGLSTFLSGVEKAEVLGKNIVEFHTVPEDILHYKKVLKTGIPFIAERVAPPHNYGDITLSVKAFKVGDGLGIVAADITDQKDMENALRKSEERLRSFMDAATDSFSMWDSEFNLIDINKTGLGMFPIKANKEEIIGKNVKNFITDETNLEKYRDVLRTGKPYLADRIFHHPTLGDKILSMKAFKMEEGLGLISTDITSRKEMENVLRENEEKFRSIFENSPIGMALTNLDYKFFEVNAVFCHMLGYQNDELIKMTFFDITLEEHLEREKTLIKVLLNGEIPSFRSEKRYQKKDKEILWVQVTTSLLRNDKGEPLNFLLMVEDITAIKDREEEIKKQLLKFKIDDGNIYLVTEEAPTLSKTVFNDLITIGYRGLIASRTPSKDFRAYIAGEYEFFWLTEKNSYESFMTLVEDSPSKSVILIDRLEYLFLKEGLEKSMQFVYKLKEVTYLRNLVVILSIDNATISDRELRILEKETHQIEPRFMAKIAEEYLEILKFVYQQNDLGLKPSYSGIGKELQISRPTVRKRVKQLIVTGYLLEHKKGKRKIVEISEKGRMLFLR